MFKEKTVIKDFTGPTASYEVLKWVKRIADFCKPDNIHWCDGSDEEYNQMTGLLVEKGTFIRLNPEKRPNSFACFSDPSDVARVEDRTFICSIRKEDAGPTNNWMDPKEMKDILEDLTEGCMTGRTMYVIPFCMGPVGSKLSRIRCSAHGLRICGYQHENHDPHGQQSCRNSSMTIPLNAYTPLAHR